MATINEVLRVDYDARLVEDTTGKGHTTIALGDEPCITATIGLKDQG